ncbi:MAG: DUF1028 domain-containing protein [Haliscomenobacteraceae bacterium CHB4]|nr:hypothetical protein [Saprospiraceae bacterium]MCE7922156.1 DUF1028 domain-containing protein [Haliscomenobacteraceae bacterium CHB4]
MKYFPVILALIYPFFPASAQDTFSIVAVDSITGEIGSAGASCLNNISFPGSNGAIIISDILPGKGAIHTQSFWLAANQANARLKMEEGLSPEDILLWLKQNDAEGTLNAQRRQYGIVDFDPQGHPRSAAFTGTLCFDWKGHKTGPGYAIQGNILLGPEILDSMEARFLATSGTLADRLMAALQGANVVGADTRCADDGTSSLSAFLRVAKPGDTDDSLYLDLNVPSLPAGMEPIDSLQRLYDQWLLSSAPELPEIKVQVFPNPAHGYITILGSERENIVELYNANGIKVYSTVVYGQANTLEPKLPNGLYFVRISREGKILLSQRLIWTGGH